MFGCGGHSLSLSNLCASLTNKPLYPLPTPLLSLFFPLIVKVVVKAQILAGGRGLGTFTNGLQGGVHIVPAADAPALAARMLGGTLVTKQTGPAGKPVNTLLVARKMALAREMYLAILLDRKAAGPVVVACSEGMYAGETATTHRRERQSPHTRIFFQQPAPQSSIFLSPLPSTGGTSIEDLAHSHPDKIVKVPVDPRVGLTDAQAATVVAALGVSGADAGPAQAQVKSLYAAFEACDCTLVEVNPLAQAPDGSLLAADAKLGFDDSAAFRQKGLWALRDPSQEDPREVAASAHDLNYIGLDGSIGCMVNGAGLAMATMDIIKLHGGAPANFLDVGGNASEQQVVEAFKILTADPQVKALLVNIFGEQGGTRGGRGGPFWPAAHRCRHHSITFISITRLSLCFVSTPPQAAS